MVDSGCTVSGEAKAMLGNPFFTFINNGPFDTPDQYINLRDLARLHLDNPFRFNFLASGQSQAEYGYSNEFIVGVPHYQLICSSLLSPDEDEITALIPYIPDLPVLRDCIAVVDYCDPHAAE